MAHILVVEDDQMNAIIFERVLTRLGKHDATVTTDAEKVLRLMQQGTVELAILDVSLSGSYLAGKRVDGLILSRILKSNPKTSHIPILLATAHAMRGDREEFLRDSLADAYVSKPISDHRCFCELINQILQRAKESVLADEENPELPGDFPRLKEG
jgi:two-component system, cell cycle response regulator DivK